MKIVRGWFAVRTPLSRKLPIEVFEELLGCADRPAVPAHGFRDASVAAMCSSTSARTRARNSGGTSERSRTTLSAKTLSCSAGVICSNSAAVISLRSTAPCYRPGATCSALTSPTGSPRPPAWGSPPDGTGSARTEPRHPAPPPLAPATDPIGTAREPPRHQPRRGSGPRRQPTE